MLETGRHGGRGRWSGGARNYAPLIQGEPNGFVDRADVTLAWSNATRTLTLTGTYDIFSDSTRYTKTGGSIQIADTEGPHFVYYDETGTLQVQESFSIDLITRYCLVAYLYWDATNDEAVPWTINELHGCVMDADTHSYLHNANGAAYISGLELTGLTVSSNPDGSSDDQCQFTSDAGEIRDEDIPQLIEARTALTDTIPVMWKEGTEASPVWRMDDTRSFPATNTGSVSGRVMYNELTGGTWGLTEVSSNNDFILAHIYSMPGLNPANGGLVAIVGEAQYATRTDVRDAAYLEAKAIALNGLPALEFTLVATLLVKTSSGYGNTPSAAFVTTDLDEDYIDWRESPRTAARP